MRRPRRRRLAVRLMPIPVLVASSVVFHARALSFAGSTRTTAASTPRCASASTACRSCTRRR
jgi:hypothetical protein